MCCVTELSRTCEGGRGQGMQLWQALKSGGLRVGVGKECGRVLLPEGLSFFSHEGFFYRGHGIALQAVVTPANNVP
eukprot:1156146-Pelagomonas_calceolata.AAC.5